MIDTHAHLTDPGFELDELLPAVAEAGVAQMISVGFDLKSTRAAIALAEKYDHIYASCGIHPNYAQNPEQLRELEQLIASPKVVAMGETGLDFHHKYTTPAEQEHFFCATMELAQSANLPVIIHSRETGDSVYEVLRRYPKVRGVIHCFDGELLERYLELGYYLSIAGPVTYKKSKALQRAIPKIPGDRLLIETDCPYLAPTPHRGRANSPVFLPLIAARVAELCGLAVADIDRITTRNAIELFGLPDADQSARIAYQIRDSLYLNITKLCSNDCGFCIRNSTDFVKGHRLHLRQEPSYKQVVAAISNHKSAYKEIVFCGYGEPLCRSELMLQIAAWIKQRAPDMPVRVNTNGHGLMIAPQQGDKNIVEQMVGLIDHVTVSLNAANAQDYNRVCRPQTPEAFGSVLEFIRQAAVLLPQVTATCLDLPRIDCVAVESLAASLGAGFRQRHYNQVG